MRAWGTEGTELKTRGIGKEGKYPKSPSPPGFLFSHLCDFGHILPSMWNTFPNIHSMVTCRLDTSPVSNTLSQVYLNFLAAEI